MGWSISASSAASAVPMRVLSMPGMLAAWPQRHDVAGGDRCRRGLGPGLGEDGGGEGELGDLTAQVADLLALRGDGPAEPGSGLAELSVLVGGLLCLGADALAELVFQIGVAFHQGHAVDAGLGGGRNDGEGAVGGDRLACEETVGGGADAAQRATGTNAAEDISP
jgi:hypothetical protein